mmetsp:Transcript_30720/g.67256  ORF Transcript_30720/g.67256 Transcript_30720/m.67256 type:complete len:86 (-) Transcript_30720:360-617(-)
MVPLLLQEDEAIEAVVPCLIPCLRAQSFEVGFGAGGSMECTSALSLSVGYSVPSPNSQISPKREATSSGEKPWWNWTPRLRRQPS